MSQVILHIDEAELHERSFETLVSYGISHDRAYELAFAICKAARRVATVEERLTPWNTNTPPKNGPYR